MKLCKNCGLRDKTKGRGSRWCIVCRSALGTENERRNSARRFSAARREYRNKWQRENRDKTIVYQRSWHAENKEYTRAYKRSRDLGTKYGLTTETWEELLNSQNRCCAICGADNPGSKLGWHTDHNHATGLLRGILCHCCNILIGVARE